MARGCRRRNRRVPGGRLRRAGRHDGRRPGGCRILGCSTPMRGLADRRATKSVHVLHAGTESEPNAPVGINLNPPHFLLLLAPLVVLEPLPAFVVWTGLSLVSAAAATRLILRETGIRAASLAGLGVVGAVIAGAPTGALLLSAQVSWLLWWPACLAWAAAQARALDNGGSLLGVLASLKPFLLVLLPFVAHHSPVACRRRSRGLRWRLESRGTRGVRVGNVLGRGRAGLAQSRGASPC